MWNVITIDGEKKQLSDIQYNNAISNGVDFADSEQISNDSDVEKSKMDKDIIAARKAALLEDYPILGGLSNFLIPDAMKSIVYEQKPIMSSEGWQGPAKTFSKTALLGAALAAGTPIAAVPSTVGRIAAGGGVGLADYLGVKAIDQESPTVKGAIASTVLGSTGQGLGEIGNVIFNKVYGVSKNLMSKLPIETVSGITKRLEQKAIEIMSSAKSNKKFTYDDIESAVDFEIDKLPSGAYSPSELAKMRVNALAGFDKDEILSIPELLNREQFLKDETAKAAIKGISKELAKGAEVSQAYGSLKTPEFKYGENLLPSASGLLGPIIGATTPSIARYVPAATRAAGPMLEDYILPQVE